MHSSTLPAIVLVSLFAIACSADKISGPEAQAAFARARSHGDAALAAGMMMFVDGHRVSSHSDLDHLDARTIRRVEIVKGPAAVRLYGDEAKRGVVLIYTVSDSAGVQAR
jgi:outer membrane receptor protein involved in Fe transport